MKSIYHTALVAVATLAITASCKEKKESDDIIVEKTVQERPAAAVPTSDYNDSREIEWSGSRYTVTVSRKADKTLPQVADGEGRKYFDNAVSIHVARADGSEFFSRRFTKADFVAYVGEEYARTNVLTGIVLDKAEPGRLLFVASVGSPDALSDEYIPMRMAISRLGEVSVERSSELDLE